MIKHLALHSRSPLAWLRTVRRPIATTVMVSFILSPYGALAGAVPDVGAPSNQQATVNTQAGVEVVGIVPPTPDGISHNKWQQFNVPAAGMVLNNATGTAASQLVGSVSANPRLNGTSASVILNEVTSNNPSSLLGPLEVAGQAARVIIANPNGITCNGCGFINTPHVQLTTGRPVFDGDQLLFQVNGGAIDIAAPGLTQLASRLDLIGQNLKVQGAIDSSADFNAFALGSQPIDSSNLKVRQDDVSYKQGLSIDIGQSVRADTIRLIVDGRGFGNIEIKAPVSSNTDLFIATDYGISIAAPLYAGRDIGIANRGTGFTYSDLSPYEFSDAGGGWLRFGLDRNDYTTPAADITAGRDFQLIGYHIALSKVTAGRDAMIFASIPFQRWSDYASLSADRLVAGRDAYLMATDGLEVADLIVGRNFMADRGQFTKFSALVPFSASFEPNTNGLTPENQPVTVDATGYASPGSHLENYDIGGDVFARKLITPNGTFAISGNLNLLNGDSDISNNTTYRAGGDIRFIADDYSPGRILNDLHAEGTLWIDVQQYADRWRSSSSSWDSSPGFGISFINASTLTGKEIKIDSRESFTNIGELAAESIQIHVDKTFQNSGQINSAQDISVVATDFINTALISTSKKEIRYTGPPLCIDGLTTNCIHPVLAEPSPEPYPGCKTKYRGTCSATVDVLKSTATIAAGRDLIIDSPSVSNRGATATAGRHIDIATNAFANTARSYGIDWSAQWSDKPLLLSQNNSTCTSNCVSDLSLDWARSATGHIDLGTLKGNMQAGGVFSVDTYPRSGTPAILTPSITPPDTAQDNANASNSAPASASSFVNTGNITAASLVIKADNIRNGLDVAQDYYQRTEAPTLPPALIELAKYGNAGFSSLAGTYSGETLMAVMPPALSSSLPFAYTPEQELAAIRSALLATTDRAWILPGLTWDAETGQSPEQQQQAILAANGAAFAIEHGIAYGTPLTTSQRAELTAPILWYANSAGQLTPTLYLPEAWQQQLIRYDGGSLHGDVAIALQADSINNTGFVLSNGLLTIDADHLSNQKRNAWYYEERDVKGGTLIIKGDTVQPGGFMQAARWDLNAQSIYSRSGEFIVAGSNAAETQALTSAFEAQIRAELGDNFTYEVAQDRLKTKFEADGGGLNIVAMVAAIVLSVVLTPAISAAIGSMAGATAGTMAGMTGASLTTAGLGNAVLTSAVTGTLSSAVGQSIATGRVDWGSAFKSGAVAGITYGITNAPILEGGATINSLGQVSTAVSGSGSTVTGYAQWGDRLMGAGARAVVNAGVSSAINGSSFIDALKSSFINDMSAYASNDIGSAFIGKEGSLGHMLTHGVLGAMSEAARGGDPTAGAIGGITAAALAQPLDDALGLQGDARKIALTAITMLAGGYAAEALGRDGVAAAGVAQNATVNNYLSHSESQEKDALTEKCGRNGQTCSSAEFTRLEQLDQLDRARDALLAASCMNPTSSACATELARLRDARTSFEGQNASPGSTAQKELSWINDELNRYQARVLNPGTYNTGTAAIGIAGDTVLGTAELAALSAKAATGDPAAQAQLSEIASAIGDFIANPADAIEQHIADTLRQADTLDAQGRTDEAQRMRATLFIEGALAVSTAGTIVAKGSGKILSTSSRVLDRYADHIATRALIESGGVIDPVSGNALLDLKQLSNAQKATMGELFGEDTVRRIIPDGTKLARMPGPGETGIDDLYKVNRPDVDYVVIEYKFVGTDSKTGAQVLGKTLDGRQGSESWSMGGNRLEKAVGDQHALDVRFAADANRVETWVVTTRPDGTTLTQVLDADGRAKPIGESNVLQPSTNLSGAQY